MISIRNKVCVARCGIAKTFLGSRLNHDQMVEIRTASMAALTSIIGVSPLRYSREAGISERSANPNSRHNDEAVGWFRHAGLRRDARHRVICDYHHPYSATHSGSI